MSAPARALLAVLAAVLAGLLPAAPASAHESDPRLTTVLDEVQPALPDGVVVQVQANLASQLVASNPTDVPLVVVATGGEPFLRISAAGVEANLESPDFFSTSNPNGNDAGAPAGSGAGTAPRWVTISRGSSWGWYDHRLHPDRQEPPADARAELRLAEWEVPLRYGDQELAVRGHVQFRPLRGGYLATAGPAPAGLVAQVLPGRLPGVLLQNPERRPLTVLGRDGEPFLRFTAAGVEVNTASRTHVEDRTARGEVAGPPSPTPRFELLSPGGTSWTWLDARLRAEQEVPAPEVLEAAEPTVVRRWEVPLVLESGPAALMGEVRWVPERAAAASVRSTAADAQRLPVLPLALGAGAVLVLVGAVLARRRTR